MKRATHRIKSRRKNNKFLRIFFSAIKFIIFTTGVVCWVFGLIFAAGIFFLSPVNVSHFETYENIMSEGSVGDISWLPYFFPKGSKNIKLRTNVENNDYKITFSLENEREIESLLKNTIRTEMSKRRRGYDPQRNRFWCRTDMDYDGRTHLIVTDSLSPAVVITNPYSDECRCNTL